MRWNRVIGLPVLALMLFSSFGVALAADVINVWTDEASYEPGKTVGVEGYTNITETVTIVITNTTGHEILSLSDDPNKDGEFSVNFQLDENATGGTYGVNATVGDIYNTTSFEVDVEVTEDKKGEDPSDFSSSDDLTCAIDRALRFIDKVNTTATALDEEGYNVTIFCDMLEELNETLIELKYNITQGIISHKEAVEIFSKLKGDLGRLNGLLHSLTKKVKEEKIERFIEHIEKLIDSTIEKVERFETENGEKLRGALEAQKRKLWRLNLTLNATNLDDTIGALKHVTEEIDGNLDEFDSEGFSLKAMYKVQARIQVFNATVERMKKKGKIMNRLEEKLGNAKQLLDKMNEQFGELNQEQLKRLLDEANENFRGVGKTIREINKSNKGGNGNGNGNGKGKKGQ